MLPGASGDVRGAPARAGARSAVDESEQPSHSIMPKVVASTNPFSMPKAAKPRATTRKVGRPPAGDGGERVKDYPQASFRLPKPTRDKLAALSAMRDQPQWRLIVESLDGYLRRLPRAERARISAQIRKMNEKQSRSR